MPPLWGRGAQPGRVTDVIITGSVPGLSGELIYWPDTAIGPQAHVFGSSLSFRHISISLGFLILPRFGGHP